MGKEEDGKNDIEKAIYRYMQLRQTQMPEVQPLLEETVKQDNSSTKKEGNEL